jgi:hypothetical protein
MVESVKADLVKKLVLKDYDVGDTLGTGKLLYK